MLFILSAPSWPTTIDDVYITLTYARHWAETGTLAWTTGEHVEGYSNFLFMAGLAGACRAGFDIDVASQIVALLSGVGALMWFNRGLPTTPGGTLSLVAIATWAPLNHWASIGMETTLYTCLLMLGWAGVSAGGTRSGWGVSWLVAASMTRPEGILHLAVAVPWLLLRFRTDRDGSSVAISSLAWLGVYHGIRIAWFGAVAPTSYLVKIAALGLYPNGAMQWAGDLLTAGGIVVCLAVAGRVQAGQLVLVLLPALLQGAVIVRASGDWMSWGRLTLPGVLASAAVFTQLATWRKSGSSALGALAAISMLTASSVEPRGYGQIDLPFRELAPLLHFSTYFNRGLDTPVAEDVAWVLDNVPNGARGLVVDAGILGDVPGFQLLDLRGLNHREAAEAVAAGTEADWLRRVTSVPTRPEFLRLAHWDGTQHEPYPEWLLSGYELRKDLRYGGGSIRWYATTNAVPSAADRRERWDEMLRRHPSHPFLAWHAALSAAELGEHSRAEELVARAHQRWPSQPQFSEGPASLSFTAGSTELTWSRGRGIHVPCGERATSRRIESGQRLAVTVTAATEGTPTEPQLSIEDPCADVSPPRGEGTFPVPICPSTRRLIVAVTCPTNEPRGAYVRLDHI